MFYCTISSKVEANTLIRLHIRAVWSVRLTRSHATKSGFLVAWPIFTKAKAMKQKQAHIKTELFKKAISECSDDLAYPWSLSPEPSQIAHIKYT